MYYTWKSIKKLYKDNKFEISTPTWNEKLDLPDGLYSISDLQDFFELSASNKRTKKRLIK